MTEVDDIEFNEISKKSESWQSRVEQVGFGQSQGQGPFKLRSPQQQSLRDMSGRQSREGDFSHGYDHRFPDSPCRSPDYSSGDPDSMPHLRYGIRYYNNPDSSPSNPPRSTCSTPNLSAPPSQTPPPSQTLSPWNYY
ncbi:unnamed protein product [Rodentolepis nana]|uniref:ETS domain-containing protein n=1 Tax=Rodentolepis nana TaxID=102285 RepID=A0A0R3TDK0_RODNA|nr:unnamed protein product [Rodentolepis nana]VDO00997.1 unnamed protein product [Rodentolepis nana]